MAARADVVRSDPWYDIDDPPGPSIPITVGATCDINSSGGSTPGTCDFFNNTGETISLLVFTVPLNPAAPDVAALQALSPSGMLFGDGVLPSPPESPIFHCGASSMFFTTCEIDFLGQPFTSMDTMLFHFSGGPGIAPGVNFSVNLNDNDSDSGMGGWSTDATGNPTTSQIGFAPDAVPEPSFTMLLGAGCALVLGFARRRRTVSR
jgi:hypothetical protein